MSSCEIPTGKINENNNQSFWLPLEEMKQLAKRKYIIEEKVKHLESVVVNPDIESASIKVCSHLIPDTMVTIAEEHLKIKKEYASVEIKLYDGEIELRDV